MIASVSFYNVVVWIHVLAVVVAFGGVFAYPVLASALATGRGPAGVPQHPGARSGRAS